MPLRSRSVTVDVERVLRRPRDDGRRTPPVFAGDAGLSMIARVGVLAGRPTSLMCAACSRLAVVRRGDGFWCGWCKRSLRVRGKGHPGPRVLRGAELLAFRSRWFSLEPIKQIASDLGVDRKTVVRWAAEQGWPPRGRSWPRQWADARRRYHDHEG